MLILTRRVGESLIIGDDITITVLGVKGNQVRIGVNAPKDISAARERPGRLAGLRPVLLWAGVDARPAPATDFIRKML